MGIIQRRAQYLTAGNVLESGGDAADGEKIRLVDRLRDGNAGLGGAVGAQQKDRLVEIAAGLGERQSGEIGFVKRCLAHQPVDEIGKTGSHGLDALSRDWAEIGAKQPLCLFDGVFATAGCYIGHQSTSIFVERGMPSRRLPSTR